MYFVLLSLSEILRQLGTVVFRKHDERAKTAFVENYFQLQINTVGEYM